ncbi:tetratricopeptide repeat protein [Dyella agri]|uniref:Tetratricopeptide repeat protein n=1 Tax=Dyella agri TaxID=1926869 RepID=A0ABW8KD09_9GAMM
MSGRRDQHESETRGRTEPRLGDLDQLDQPPKSASPRDEQPWQDTEPRGWQRASKMPQHRPRRWLVPVLVLALIGVVGAALIEQNRLRNLLPRTELNDVLGRAQQALAAGHLDGDDGTSARELFQAAVALEPDNDAARNGLHQVGMAEISQADAALQAGQFDVAAQKAAVARELLGGGSDLDRLDQQIAAKHSSKVQVSVLVQQAQQAFAANQFSGEHGAGTLYRQVLQADPGNAVARHGLDQVGDALAAQAQKALDANDGASADAVIEQLAALQPNNAALPGLRAARAQAHQQDTAALDTALQQGDEALRAGRIDGPGDDTALAHYKAALALSPDNPQAEAGLGKVAQALTVQADAALDAGDTAQAGTLLDHAEALAPKSADLAAARARLQGMQAHKAAPAPAAPPANDAQQPAAATPAPPALTPQQSAQVSRLLEQAQAATQRGDIMLPPGNSAYDLYRNALAIDGDSAVAQHGLQALPGVVQQLFNRALAAGDLVRAGQMLENLGDLAPGDASQGIMSQRLASAWLDQADRQLAQGDRAGAAQSLQQARKLAPNHPRVLDLSARLQPGS